MWAVLLCCCAHLVQAQDLNRKISLTVDNAPLESVLNQLSSTHNIPLFYNVEVVEAQPPVSASIDNMSVRDALNLLLGKTTLAWTVVGKNIVLRPINDLSKEERQDWELPRYASANLRTLSGYIIDKQSGEALIGATLKVKNEPYATVANQYGFFSLSMPRLKKPKN